MGLQGGLPTWTPKVFVFRRGGKTHIWKPKAVSSSKNTPAPRLPPCFPEPSSMQSDLGELEGELADMLHPTEKQNRNSSGARQCLWGGRENGELMWAVCSNKGSHHRSMCWLDRSKCSHLTWVWQLKWERCFAAPQKKGGYEGGEGKAQGHHSPSFRNIPGLLVQISRPIHSLSNCGSFWFGLLSTTRPCSASLKLDGDALLPPLSWYVLPPNPFPSHQGQEAASPLF